MGTGAALARRSHSRISPEKTAPCAHPHRTPANPAPPAAMRRGIPAGRLPCKRYGTGPRAHTAHLPGAAPVTRFDTGAARRERPTGGTRYPSGRRLSNIA